MCVSTARKYLCHFSITVFALAVAIGQADAHGMPVVVQADGIMIGTDVVPRFLNLSRVLVVAAGTTVTPAADSTWDYIEVAGTLRVARDRDTILRFTHLFVRPGGVLDVGTQGDPIPADRRVELIVRGGPAIDTRRDPFQWGNGLLNFGRQTRVGSAKRAWTSTIGDIAPGATRLVLSEDPTGWRIGDELLLPDTRQTTMPARPRREAPVFIAALDGRAVTLTKPLDFEHNAIRDPEGSVVLLPRVANLTRNVVVRSENAQATPGHTANIGMDATWDVRYNEFVALGRTQVGILDSVNLATNHIGTNQVGRYADHHHHAQGFGSSSVGNVYRAAPGNSGKWGVAVHGTHDELLEENIAVGFPGAGFVTEDGYETRNVFRRNFSAYSFGNHNGNANAEDTNTFNNAPGSAGNGFWFRGIQNTFDGNEAWNNAIGFNLFNFRSVAGNFPSVPGGELDTPFNHFVAIPVQHTGTVTAANVVDGLEFWGVPETPTEDPISTSNGSFDLFSGLSDNASIFLRRPTFIGKGNAFGVETQVAYTVTMRIEGGRIEGYASGVHGGGHYNFITGTLLRNRVNIDWTDVPDTSYQENVDHQSLPGLPEQFIKFGTNSVWSGQPPFPVVGVSPFLFQSGSRHQIKNWQGTGQDFRLFTAQQRADLPVWPSTNQNIHMWNPPEAGLTMGQAWAKYGMAYLGEAFDSGRAVALEGLAGFALPGLKAALGPPRGIITFPTESSPAQLTGGTITAFAILSGASTGLADQLMVSVDGGVPFLVGPPDSGPRDARSFNVNGLARGSHEIRTWRMSANMQPLGSSLMTFRFAADTVIEPPTPVLPPVLVPPPPVPPPPPAPEPTWATLDGVAQRFGKQNRYRICTNGLCTEFVLLVPQPSPPPASTDRWLVVVGAVMQRFGTQDRFRICQADACTELVLR
jgi:hypothetical protein